MARSQELAAGERFPPHAHDWNQVVFATHGVLQVTARNARHVITPQQALEHADSRTDLSLRLRLAAGLSPDAGTLDLREGA